MKPDTRNRSRSDLETRNRSASAALAPPPTLGIDLGGTQIKAVVASAGGEILRRESLPSRDGEVDRDEKPLWLNAITGLCRKWVAEGLDIAAAGIASPGLAAADGRSMAVVPVKLPGLEGLDWVDAFGGKLDCVALNDAHAALAGEQWLGGVREFRDVILLTLGTGVGGALMLDGRLVQGHNRRAGHFGHICLDPSGGRSITGMPGALEVAIGESTVKDRCHGRYQDTRSLVEAYRNGDPFAREVWLRSVHALACGIASLINAVDPEAVVLAGGIVKAGPDLLDPLNEAMESVEWRPFGNPVPIVRATLGEWAGAIGAARTARDRIEKR